MCVRICESLKGQEQHTDVGNDHEQYVSGRQEVNSRFAKAFVVCREMASRARLDGLASWHQATMCQRPCLAAMCVDVAAAVEITKRI